MSEGNGKFSPAVDPAYVFDNLEPKTFYTRIRGKLYVLKGAETGMAVQYRNACSKAAKWEGSPDRGMKVVGFDGLAGTEVLLVQGCTFEVIEDGPGQLRHGPVARGWVEKLPPGVTSKLFAKIVELSPGLRGDVETDASDASDASEDSLPKDSPATTTESS